MMQEYNCQLSISLRGQISSGNESKQESKLYQFDPNTETFIADTSFKVRIIQRDE
jgi:hypothetical protein